MNVLIIDDHPLFITALDSVLQNLDPHIRTSTAGSVAQALEYLDDHSLRRKSIQLILLDLSMPGLDGLALLHILEQRHLTASVIVVSSYEEPEVIRSCIDAGAQGYIPKSYTPEQMKNAIRQVLNGEIFLPLECDPLQPIHSGTSDETERLRRCTDLGISRKHYQVLLCMADGMTNKEIANKLYVSVHTVKAHAAKLFEKLRTGNRMDTVMEAVKLGLIDK